MFKDWKIEKATAALVDEAQALADKLATAKPHVVDSHAAAARFWEASCLADGQALHDMMHWPAPQASRFAASLQGRITALRKARDYDKSDGLAIWLHTVRSVTEPRLAPAVAEIWQRLLAAGQNADAMAIDQITEAGLPTDPGRRAPRGLDMAQDRDPA